MVVSCLLYQLKESKMFDHVVKLPPPPLPRMFVGFFSLSFSFVLLLSLQGESWLHLFPHDEHNATLLIEHLKNNLYVDQDTRIISIDFVLLVRIFDNISCVNYNHFESFLF